MPCDLGKLSTFMALVCGPVFIWVGRDSRHRAGGDLQSLLEVAMSFCVGLCGAGKGGRLSYSSHFELDHLTNAKTQGRLFTACKR
jgi:hypothetical protein